MENESFCTKMFAFDKFNDLILNSLTISRSVNLKNNKNAKQWKTNIFLMIFVIKDLRILFDCRWYLISDSFKFLYLFPETYLFSVLIYLTLVLFLFSV